MNTDEVMTVLAAGSVGAAVAAGLARLRLSAPPSVLMRTNVNGKQVPAVLGGPLTVAGSKALASVAVVAAAGWQPAQIAGTGVAAAAVVAVMGIAGGWDDRRGDERARGFKGHLAALRGGRVTGGLLKIAAGVVAGGTAGLLVFEAAVDVVACMLLVALGANTVNLFDRAPGRAGKVYLVVAVPLLVFGHAGWAVAAAGATGALIACMPLDLDERGMLGDAGANPLGALMGLGLALSLGPAGRWLCVAILAAVNVAAERWSFSHIIGSRRWLRTLDEIGRK